MEYVLKVSTTAMGQLKNVYYVLKGGGFQSGSL